MNLINRIRTLRFRYVPLTLIPIVITIGMGLLERYVEFRDENDDLLLLIAALLFVCICADGLRIAVSYIPIPGGTFAKRAILVVGVLVIVGLTVSTVHEMRGPTMFYTESYQCENDTSFTATFSSDERVHIVEDGGVIRDLSLSSDVMENYNDGIVGYTFLHNQAIVTQMGDEPRSTFCSVLDTIHRVGTLDPTAQEEIMNTIKKIDTDVTLREVTLNNDYFVSLGSATDNGQELSGFFKGDHVVKLYYNVGISFGTRKYLYYFDNGQLIYVYEEESAFPLTQDGESLDYSRLDFVFGAGYFYQNGKLVQVNSKGGRKYSQDISQDFIASADELHTLLDSRFVAGKSTYTNNEFGFKFSYPSTWTKEENAFKERGAKNDGMVFSIDFVDPFREREIEVNACLSNRCVDWANSRPTKSSCELTFASLEIAHDDSCGELKSPRDIFVRIYKSNEPLPRWLISHYKVSHSELEDYKLGKSVELSGVHGYLSSTGCCGGVDRAYVVKQGDYIYEVGSRDTDVLLLEAYIKGFLFI